MISALPHIVPFEVDDDINFGDSVQMNCHVSKGDMPIKIHWLHNGLPPFSNTGITVQKLGQRSSVLTISNVKAEHSGNFTCMASNIAGTANFTLAVHVKGITFILPYMTASLSTVLSISFKPVHQSSY